MTTTEITLIVLSILAIIIGPYLIYCTFKRGSVSQNDQVTYDKNGIPIIPRHERNLIDEPDIEDSLSGETVITPDRSHLEAVIADDAENTDKIKKQETALPTTQPQNDSTQLHAKDTPSSQLQSAQRLNSTDSASSLQNNAKKNFQNSFHNQPHDLKGSDNLDSSDKQDSNSSSESDLFSSLASATENLMPVIETASEPEFTENSPVLDKHLLAEATQDQNSPLNNAEENINITLATKDSFTVIAGNTLLELVDQYGLKYGAMNMFHRYENKDGTGILWFSMMGVTPEGVVPFDLNTLPESEFNGIVLFLSLPHPKALTGFDSMMSSAGVIAAQLNLNILNEHNEPLTREYKQQLRNAVQEYQQASLQW